MSSLEQVLRSEVAPARGVVFVGGPGYMPRSLCLHLVCTVPLWEEGTRGDPGGQCGVSRVLWAPQGGGRWAYVGLGRLQHSEPEPTCRSSE